MPRTENLLADALRRSIRYLEGARTRRVSPAQAGVERLAELGGSLPEHPVDAQHTLGLKLETPWDDDDEDEDMPHRREDDDTAPDEDDPGEDDDEDEDDEEPLRT